MHFFFISACLIHQTRANPCTDILPYSGFPILATFNIINSVWFDTPISKKMIFSLNTIPTSNGLEQKTGNNWQNHLPINFPLLVLSFGSQVALKSDSLLSLTRINGIAVWIGGWMDGVCHKP